MGKSRLKLLIAGSSVMKKKEKKRGKNPIKSLKIKIFTPHLPNDTLFLCKDNGKGRLLYRHIFSLEENWSRR
jgi:hypothetical protein